MNSQQRQVLVHYWMSVFAYALFPVMALPVQAKAESGHLSPLTHPFNRFGSQRLSFIAAQPQCVQSNEPFFYLPVSVKVGKGFYQTFVRALQVNCLAKELVLLHAEINGLPARWLPELGLGVSSFIPLNLNNTLRGLAFSIEGLGRKTFGDTGMTGWTLSGTLRTPRACLSYSHELWQRAPLEGQAKPGAKAHNLGVYLNTQVWRYGPEVVKLCGSFAKRTNALDEQASSWYPWLYGILAFCPSKLLSLNRFKQVTLELGLGARMDDLKQVFTSGNACSWRSVRGVWSLCITCSDLDPSTPVRLRQGHPWRKQMLGLPSYGRYLACEVYPAETPEVDIAAQEKTEVETDEGASSIEEFTKAGEGTFSLEEFTKAREYAQRAQTSAEVQLLDKAQQLEKVIRYFPKDRETLEAHAAVLQLDQKEFNRLAEEFVVHASDGEGLRALDQWMHLVRQSPIKLESLRADSPQFKLAKTAYEEILGSLHYYKHALRLEHYCRLASSRESPESSWKLIKAFGKKVNLLVRQIDEETDLRLPIETAFHPYIKALLFKKYEAELGSLLTNYLTATNQKNASEITFKDSILVIRWKSCWLLNLQFRANRLKLDAGRFAFFEYELFKAGQSLRQCMKILNEWIEYVRECFNSSTLASSFDCNADYINHYSYIFGGLHSLRLQKKLIASELSHTNARSEGRANVLINQLKSIQAAIVRQIDREIHSLPDIETQYHAKVKALLDASSATYISILSTKEQERSNSSDHDSDVAGGELATLPDELDPVHLFNRVKSYAKTIRTLF